MDKFIQCACKNNLRVLVVSGSPTDVELSLAWIDIKSQHLENVNDPVENYNVSIIHTIHEFEMKNHRVLVLLELFRIRYDIRIIEQLNEEGYDYSFTIESYIDDIDKVFAELKSEEMEIDTFREQLGSLKKEGMKPSEQVYYKSFTLFQKTLGACPMLTPMQMAKQVTVFEYGTYINMYNDYIQSSKLTEHGEPGY